VVDDDIRAHEGAPRQPISLPLHCSPVTHPSHNREDGALELEVREEKRSKAKRDVRYMAPNHHQSLQQDPTVQMDLFSLGLTIYYIITGKAPLEEFRSEEVVRKYSAQDFPDLTGICHAQIIKRC
jgi:hypothetical protein